MKSGSLHCFDWAIMAATSVQATGDCDTSIVDWRTREALRASAEGRGSTLKRIKIDDGGYEIYGANKDGHRSEAKSIP